MAKLIITVPEKEDLADFMVTVQKQIEQGFTQWGFANSEYHWELID